MKPSCRIVRWPRLLVVLISCTMLAVLSTAPTAAMPAHQAQTSGKVAINQVLWDHYPTVTLLVTVNNPGGGARGGLAEDAFTISEDGASIPLDKVELSTVEQKRTPIQMALAMDVSGSMNDSTGPGGPTKIEAAKAAATAFVDRLNPGDRVALFSFNDSVEKIRDFTDNKEVLKDSIDRLEAKGNTALFDAIFMVARAVQERQGRRAFIVVTDGKNEPPGRGDILGAVTAAVDAEAPGYTIGFGAPGTVDDETLATIAQETHGAMLREPSATQIGALFDQLSGLLDSQYIITYPTNLKPEANPKPHPLEVSVKAGDIDARDKVMVILPTTLTPPAVTATATVTPTATPNVDPEPPGMGALGWLLGLLAVIALAGLGAWLMMRQRPRRCPTCKRVMDPSWTVCLFCHPREPQRPTKPIPEPTPVEPLPRRNDETITEGPQTVMAWLMGVEGSVVGREYRLSEQGTTVGRDARNTYRLDDPFVSGDHIKIKYERDAFVLYDMASKGGTFVNGQPMEGRHVLQEDDRVKIGHSVFVYKRVR